MQFRTIGDLSVSVVGLGCNNFGRRISAEDTAAVVTGALEAGINFFDTADRYGYGDLPYSGFGRSEEFLGRALGSRRGEVVIATKFGNPMSEADPSMRGGGRDWVIRACDDSLRRLQTDYIDLYQMHVPDPDTPIDETLEALTHLREAGKVREIGCSNFGVDLLREADQASAATEGARFRSVQNEYSLLERDAESDVLPFCRETGISFIPYFPLASGLLTGKYRRDSEAPAGSRLSDWTPRSHFKPDTHLLDRVEKLIDAAEANGHTILELAFAWLLARTEVASVVAGATTPAQVRSNAAAAGWTLSPGEIRAIDRV